MLGGTGQEGSGLAFRWAHAGHRVILGSRDADKAGKIVSALRVHEALKPAAPDDAGYQFVTPPSVGRLEAVARLRVHWETPLVHRIPITFAIEEAVARSAA